MSEKLTKKRAAAGEGGRPASAATGMAVCGVCSSASAEAAGRGGIGTVRKAAGTTAAGEASDARPGPRSGEAAAYARRWGLDRLVSPDLLGRLSLRRCRRGEFIIRSGDEVDSLCFLVEGCAKGYRQMENGISRLVAFYHPLEILGDLELFSYGHYILTVEAIEDSVCLRLPRAAIIERADTNGKLLVDLCGRLGRKLGAYNVASAINLSYPVECRLASYLLAAQDEASERKGGLHQVELAELLGASYRQLSRVIRRFKAEGILGSARGKLNIIDRDKLAGIARDIYTPQV